MFSILSAIFLDQEVQADFEITSLQIKNEALTIKLNKTVKDAKFYINGKLFVATATGTDNTYVIASSTALTNALKRNEENTLEVKASDGNNVVKQSKTFIYRKLTAPDSVTVAASSGNDVGAVNASNVTSATVLIKYNDSNINKVPVTVELTITDSKKNKISLSKELTGFETESRIENVDFSSLVDGNLNVKEIVKDNQGNIVESTVTSAIEKKAESPIVKYSTVARSNATAVTINGIVTSDEVNETYYLVKESGEAAPTVEQVVNANQKLTITAQKTASLLIMVFLTKHMLYIL